MLRNTATGYGWVAIVLHWAVASLFLVQLGLGLVMVRVASQRTAFDLIQLHKSVGFLLLGLVSLRIGWRLGNRPPHLPPGTGALERRAAPVAHFALYLAQVALPISGWALVSVSVLAIPSVPFGLFVMPDLPLGVSASAEGFWAAAHLWLAYGAIGLVCLHIAAALRHHLMLGDNVLSRMIVPSPARGNSPSSPGVERSGRG